MKTKKNFTIP